MSTEEKEKGAYKEGTTLDQNSKRMGVCILCRISPRNTCITGTSHVVCALYSLSINMIARGCSVNAALLPD